MGAQHDAPAESIIIMGSLEGLVSRIVDEHE